MESKRKLFKTTTSLRKILVFLVILAIALPVTGTVSAATPPSLVITNTTSNVTLPSSGIVTLSASVTFTGGTAPAGWINTTLTTPSGVLTTPFSVTGNKSFTVSTTLPTAGLIAGTYTWAAAYTDDVNSDNNTVSNQIQTTVYAADTTLAPNASSSTTIGSSPAVLSSSVNLSGGYYPTGTITFNLHAPSGAVVDTETVAVNGNGTYTTPTGFTLTPSGAVTGTYTWYVLYSGDSNNINSTTSNDCSVTVIPLQADLSITTTAINATPNVGDTIAITVTVKNNGPASATGVVVNDLLPAGLTFVSATPSQGSYNSSTGAWTVGTVAVASPVSLLLQARVVSPNTQTNSATISQADQSDPDISNNSATVMVTPQQADLSVANTVSNATPNVGDTITFTVTVSNNGPDRATNVVVTDSLPAGLTFVSATPSPGTTYDSISGDWTIGTVAQASAPSLKLQAEVVSPNAQTDTATISRADQYDPNTVNNTASVAVTPVAPQAPTYTVTFDSRQGSSVSNISGVPSGSTISAPAAPTLSGYTFVGWYRESSYTTAWNFSIDTVTGNLTLFAKWMYNGGGGSGSVSGSSGGNSSDSSGGSGNPPVTSTYYAVASGTGMSGSTLPIITNTDAGSAAVDLGNMAEYKPNGEKTIVITMPGIPGVNTYTLGIPIDYLSTPDSKGILVFNTNIGGITLPAGMLANIGGSKGQKAEITISRGDKSGLPNSVKTAIGDRPLIQLTVSIGGKRNNPNAPVMISIPYTPTAAELASPESIVIWYIDDSSKAVSVPNGQYDPVTGTVTFSTTHFCNYAVAYNQVSFKDVAAGTWFGQAVSFIAAREITTGTSSGNYSPDTKLIRGDFLVMLMKSYGIAADTNPADNFSDASNAYYTGYLAAAKRLGISSGVGNNMFAPKKEITRQEMFTLLYNALKVIGKLPQSHSGRTLSDFTDANLIDSWAKEAMTLLIETGSIGGNAGKLTPTSTTTRAEMAQVLYNLLAK
ncbi:S-layer homology domain-containing protein [Paenibacillus dokdonensis]|uniref:S-layer homology domain-containing protein n=1 Tax=Paenibacillus dokdonensis TaxID=2567944 RepID=UPI0010A8937B|nr:S-layer homology domain-containing protein [Paenibacillus dokdonensis]